jgi:hypothetical protein
LIRDMEKIIKLDEGLTGCLELENLDPGIIT